MELQPKRKIDIFHEGNIKPSARTVFNLLQDRGYTLDRQTTASVLTFLNVDTLPGRVDIVQSLGLVHAVGVENEEMHILAMRYLNDSIPNWREASYEEIQRITKVPKISESLMRKVLEAKYGHGDYSYYTTDVYRYQNGEENPEIIHAVDIGVVIDKTGSSMIVNGTDIQNGLTISMPFVINQIVAEHHANEFLT